MCVPLQMPTASKFYQKSQIHNPNYHLQVSPLLLVDLVLYMSLRAAPFIPLIWVGLWQLVFFLGVKNHQMMTLVTYSPCWQKNSFSSPNFFPNFTQTAFFF
jgi:hypothetical protein